MKYLLITLSMLGLLACDPTNGNTRVVEDCQDFVPAECIRASVSGSSTHEQNGRVDGYRFCYCLTRNRTEVIMYAAPSRYMLTSLN